MKTSRKQNSPNGEERSTCSREVSRASLSASLDEGLERKMTATSGRTCYELYGRYSPLGSLARTLLESLRWYSQARRLRWDARTIYSMRITFTERSGGSLSTKSARVLSERDIPSSRLSFQLVPSELPTGGTGCGLLPTVTAQDFKRRGPNSKQQGLPEAARDGLLPTPTSIDCGSGRINKSTSPNAKERPTIAMAAKMGLLPTHTASCHNAGTTVNRKDGTSRESELNHLVARQVGHTSQLNPLFVEEMMGFPLDWLVSPFLDGEANR